MNRPNRIKDSILLPKMWVDNILCKETKPKNNGKIRTSTKKIGNKWKDFNKRVIKATDHNMKILAKNPSQQIMSSKAIRMLRLLPLTQSSLRNKLTELKNKKFQVRSKANNQWQINRMTFRVTQKRKHLLKKCLHFSNLNKRNSSHQAVISNKVIRTLRLQHLTPSKSINKQVKLKNRKF